MSTREDEVLALLEELRGSVSTGRDLALENQGPRDAVPGEEFQSRTDRALATADSILAARRRPSARQEAPADPTADELAAGGDPGQPSPAGVFPAQARFMKRLQERGELARSPGQELSLMDRVKQRFAGGAADELTLGRGEEFFGEEFSEEQREAFNIEGFDAGDVAEVAGRFLGAVPLALTTGGLARVGARTVASRISARSPGTARALLALSDGVTKKDAPRLMRILASSPTRNMFEGAAYSAVAGPVRKLHDGQSRARAIAEEAGIGAAADFMLGFVFGAPGAQLDNSLRALFRSDNQLDREVAEATAERLAASTGEDPLQILRGEVGDAMPPLREPPNTSPEPSAAELRSAVEAGLIEGDLEARAPTTRALSAGPPEFERARFRAAEGAEETLAAPTDEGTIEGVFTGPRRPRVEDTETEVAGLLAPQAGGPRLARGEVEPAELSLLREDVSVERNRPFLSRVAQEEAEIRPEAAPVEAPGAPTTTRGVGQLEEAQAAPAAREGVEPDELAAVDEALGAGPGGEVEALAQAAPPAAREWIQAIATAESRGDVAAALTRVSELGLDDEVAAGVRTLAERRIAELGAGRSPRPEGPSGAPEEGARAPAPEAPAAVPRRARGPLGSEFDVPPEVQRQLEEGRGAEEALEVERRAFEQERRELQTDQTTGLANKDSMLAARERVDADPEQEWAFFDLTDFKAINDVFGDVRGDERLAEMGRVMREAADEMGIPLRNLFRAGGDEFAAAVPAGQADEFVRRIQDGLEDFPVQGRSQAGEDVDLVSGVRGGAGPTREEASIAAFAKKAEETGPKYRSLSPEKKADLRPRQPPREATPPAEQASVEDIPAEARAPEPENGVAEIEAREWEAKAGQRRELIRDRIQGVQGRATRILAADETEVAARFEVVELDDVVPSHDPENGFRPNDERGFPEEAQNRDYERDSFAQAQVYQIGKKPDFRILLDPTIRPNEGPPMVFTDGVAANGNSRIMGAKLWDDARQREYRAALEKSAGEFGLDPAAIRGMKRPLLVRVVDDPQVDPRNIADMAVLNRAFDKQSGKSRSPEREAAFKVKEMLRAERSLEFLHNSLEADETVRDLLSTSRGREFLDALEKDGVIPKTERSLYQNPESGRVTSFGKDMIEKLMENAALRDPDLVAAAPLSWLSKIRTATPALVKTSQIEGWDISGILQDAFRLGVRIDQNPNIAGADRVGQLMQQLDAFGSQDLNPQVVALARAIDDGNPNAVKKALRGYAADAQSGGLFGTAVTPEQSFQRWFGKADIQADGTIRGRKGEAVEMDDLMKDLRARIETEGDRKGRLPEDVEERLIESFPEDVRAMARGAAESANKLIEFATERGILGEQMLRAALNGDPPPGAVLDSPPTGAGGYLAVGPIKSAADKFWRKWFTAPSDLREDVWRRSLRSNRWAKSEMKRAEFHLSELRTALKEVYGSSNLTEKQLQPLRQFLSGERPLETIPAPLRESAGAMRQHIDGFSQQFIDSGLVQGRLEATFAQNMGAYLTRTYRIFSDPEWAHKVPDDVKNRAINMLAGEGRTREEARLLVEQLLLRADDDALTPLQFLTGKGLAPKDLSMLTRRKDIAPEIRELWGEELNPMVNYVRSVDRMAATLSQHKFMSELAEMGEGSFLFRENTAKDGEDFVAELVPERFKDDVRWSPLAGLKGTKEFRDALRFHLRDREPGGFAFRTYMKANGTVKFAKIIPSLGTQVRNVMSMLYFSVRNGNFPLHRPGESLKAALLPFSNVQRGVKGQTLEVLGEEMSYEDFFTEGVELGVIAESARANELLDIIQDAQKQGLEGDPSWLLGGAVGKAAKGALRVGTELYRAGDDVVKIANYMASLKQFRKAFPDMENRELKEYVAEIMTDEFPTYSQVPEIVKEMRRVPLVGTFVSWPWEVFRTNFNFLKRTRDFMQSDNKVLRGIGVRRAVGMGAAGLGISAAAAATSRFISGIDEQNEEAMRRFLPRWSENNPLVWAGRDENGMPRYVDQGYTDPFTPGKAAWKAMMRGEDFGEKLAQASWTLLEPFLGEEILAGRLVDLSRNQTRDGRRIWNPALPELERRQEQFKYLVEAFTPGTLERLQNAIERGDVTETAIGEVSGMRLRTLDVPRSLGFNARKQVERRTDATSILSRQVFNPRARVEDIQQSYQQMESARRELWREAHEDARAAYQLGMDERAVLTQLNEAGWSRQDAVDIFVGRYRPWTPSARSMEIRRGTPLEEARMIQRNKAIVGELVRREYQRLNELQAGNR